PVWLQARPTVWSERPAGEASRQWRCVLVWVPWIPARMADNGVCDSGTCPRAELPEYCVTEDNSLPTGLCYVEDFLSWSAGPARELLLNRFALLVSFIMILQFHLMPLLAYWCEKYKFTVGAKVIRAAFGHSRKSNFLRSLGRHIYILNIYYSGAFEAMEAAVFGSHEHQPFIESLLFAFFESLFVNQFFRYLQKNRYDYEFQEAKAMHKNLREIIVTKFADYSVPWGFSTILFIAQFMLFSVFILDMNGDENTHCRCKMNIYHWFAAVLVTNVSGHDESGGTFKQSAWHFLWTSESNQFKVKDYPVEGWSRWFYDSTINAFCREVLLCLAPVALSVSDRNDLVKDCLAIFFISRMDDIEPRTIENSLKDWSEQRMLLRSSGFDQTTEVEEGLGQTSQAEAASGPEGQEALLGE
ncbi:unnamed protein product, partial [Prorocentrum cordatum]